MAAEDILSYLIPGQWVSGEDMARRMAVSRASVWKQICSLRRKGYQISSSTRKGYLLARRPDLLEAARIKSALTTRWLGREICILQETSSTNALAVSSIRESCSGKVILAETQKEGRGRLSRHWSSPPGGIWMSLVLRPDIPLSRVYRINMAIATAIALALSRNYGVKAGIKWPNDLLIREQKVCGILTELGAQVDRLDYAVVGIGLNVNNDVSAFPTEWRSTSLAAEVGREIDRSELVAAILNEMEVTVDDLESREIYEEWHSRCITLGRQVRITSAGGDLLGEAVDLAEDGALVLRQGGELVRVLAGDCIHLRPIRDSAQ